MDDKQIIQLFFRRSKEAISAFSEKYGAKLHSLANAIIGDYHDAQECVNDTLLALWNTIPPQEPDPLLTYACRITRNIALNLVRNESAQRRRSAYDLSLDELSDHIGAASLENELDVHLLGQCINDFLGTLSRDNRRIFLRRYWFGDSVKDIAKTFSLSENTVSTRLNRIRNKLKDYLTQEGYYEK